MSLSEDQAGHALDMNDLLRNLDNDHSFRVTLVKSYQRATEQLHEYKEQNKSLTDRLGEKEQDLNNLQILNEKLSSSTEAQTEDLHKLQCKSSNDDEQISELVFSVDEKNRELNMARERLYEIHQVLNAADEALNKTLLDHQESKQILQTRENSLAYLALETQSYRERNDELNRKVKAMRNVYQLGEEQRTRAVQLTKALQAEQDNSSRLKRESEAFKKAFFEMQTKNFDDEETIRHLSERLRKELEKTAENNNALVRVLTQSTLAAYPDNEYEAFELRNRLAESDRQKEEYLLQAQEVIEHLMKMKELADEDKYHLAWANHIVGYYATGGWGSSEKHNTLAIASAETTDDEKDDYYLNHLIQLSGEQSKKDNATLEGKLEDIEEVINAKDTMIELLKKDKFSLETEVEEMKYVLQQFTIHKKDLEAQRCSGKALNVSTEKCLDSQRVEQLEKEVEVLKLENSFIPEYQARTKAAWKAVQEQQDNIYERTKKCMELADQLHDVMLAECEAKRKNDEREMMLSEAHYTLLKDQESLTKNREIIQMLKEKNQLLTHELNKSMADVQLAEEQRRCLEMSFKDVCEKFVETDNSLILKSNELNMALHDLRRSQSIVGEVRETNHFMRDEVENSRTQVFQKERQITRLEGVVTKMRQESRNQSMALKDQNMCYLAVISSVQEELETLRKVHLDDANKNAYLKAALNNALAGNAVPQESDGEEVVSTSETSNSVDDNIQDISGAVLGN